MFVLAVLETVILLSVLINSLVAMYIIYADGCLLCVRFLSAKCSFAVDGSVAEWLACWTQAQKGLGSNRSSDAFG